MVDSRYLYGRGDVLQGELPPIPKRRASGVLTHCLEHGSTNGSSPTTIRMQKEYGLDNGKEFPEVMAALNGASVSGRQGQ